MISRKDLNARLEALKSKGVRLEQAFVQADLRSLGKLISAESEITVAELVGERLGKWGGITIHPLYESPIDVDLDIKDQGTQFSLQVKTFEFLTSKYDRRMSDAVRNWDATLPEGQSGYVAQRYLGTELVSEVVNPVEGMAKPARAGSLYFEPSERDLQVMGMKVVGAIKEAQVQLRQATGIRVVVFDVRHSYIDSETLYLVVREAMTSSLGEHLESAVILTYEFDQGHLANRVMAPIWISPGNERAMALFRPSHSIQLVRARPFAMPLGVYMDKPGWNDLVVVDKGIVKIGGVPFGPLLGE